MFKGQVNTLYFIVIIISISISISGPKRGSTTSVIGLFLLRPAGLTGERNINKWVTSVENQINNAQRQAETIALCCLWDGAFPANNLENRQKNIKRHFSIH